MFIYTEIKPNQTLFKSTGLSNTDHAGYPGVCFTSINYVMSLLPFNYNCKYKVINNNNKYELDG